MLMTESSLNLYLKIHQTEAEVQVLSSSKANCFVLDSESQVGKKMTAMQKQRGKRVSQR